MQMEGWRAAQQLGALAVLREELDSIPSTHKGAHNRL